MEMITSRRIAFVKNLRRRTTLKNPKRGIKTRIVERRIFIVTPNNCPECRNPKNSKRVIDPI
jgi:hypothetical protein